MKELPLSKVYQMLEPGPVVLLHRPKGPGQRHGDVLAHDGRVRTAAGRPRRQQRRLQLEALRATKECVIAVPAVELAEKVMQVGNSSGRDIDKFKAFDLTPVPAERVKPSLIAKCFANLECRVVDTRLVNKYCLFVLEVLKAWTDPKQKNPKTIHHRGYGTFAVDGEIIRLKSKMR